jgi:hypothetical protein
MRANARTVVMGGIGRLPRAKGIRRIGVSPPAARTLALAGSVLASLAASAYAVPTIAVDSSPFTFSPPSIIVGGGGRETLRRIRNMDSDPLTISITLGGTNPGDFTLGGCARVTL